MTRRVDTSLLTGRCGISPSHAHAQLSQYIDPNDPHNLTKLCDQYLTLPGTTGEGIMQCLPYYNDTVKEKLGFTGPEWDK
jgi:hypothetical protein